MKNIKAFIEKWNVGYEDPGQQAEFAREMRKDIGSLIAKKDYCPNNNPNWLVRAEAIFNKITANGMREMTLDRFNEAVAELQKSPLV